MNPHPDQQYIEALKKNDSILIKKIYTNWYPDVERFVLKNSGTKQQAENLFQEALITLWEKVKTTKVELKVPFGAYFYPIYRFKWLNYLNRDKERKNTDTSVEIKDVEKYGDTIIDWDLKERRLNVFGDCFKKLSEDCQKMFNLKFEGKKASEIAEITGKPSSNAVFVAMHTCRKKLETYIRSHPEFNTLGLKKANANIH